MEEEDIFNINELAAKCRSKYELYHLIATEGNIYLPVYRDATQKYLRQILLGKKKYLNNSEVKIRRVPQYKGLRVSDIVEFGNSIINLTLYLPDFSYDRELNRECVCNVVNTLLPVEFAELITLKVKERNEEVLRKQNLMLEAKPKFIKLFQESKAISLKKGKSHFLARTPRNPKALRELDKLRKENVHLKNKTEFLRIDCEKEEKKNEKLEHEKVKAENYRLKLEKLAHLGDCLITTEILLGGWKNN
ncbi:unnamed protein product [Moneuplotes crassus]|uniref:Uncharacterized protein n=1 Tax=Euplotes crassus TaxID=5936 RepID=A0AAD1UGS0_EUPCR|nr:unnamed protein product [Moneuplotes crassus]